jgi:glycerophosphoryl diester phosphodiesterase family protein
MRSLDIGRVVQGVFDNYASLFSVLLIGALIIYLPIALATAVFVSGGGWLAVLVGTLLSFVGLFWYEAVVTLAVDARANNRTPDPAAVFAAAGPMVVPIVIASIVAGLGILVGLIFLLVPGLYLATRWAVLIPVIVVEKESFSRAFGRSWDLVSSSGWQVFFTIVGIALVSGLIGNIVGGIGRDLSDGLVASLSARSQAASSRRPSPALPPWSCTLS